MKRAYTRLQRLVDIEPGEVRAMLWAFSYFFSLLCSYSDRNWAKTEVGVIGRIFPEVRLTTMVQCLILLKMPAAYRPVG